MKKNISIADRIIRSLFAIAVLVLYFNDQIEGIGAILLAIAAVIVAATAVFSFCPIYHFLGISTLRKSTRA